MTMGVNHLWSFIQPAGQNRSLSTLSGQTLAVDLSMWVCESQSVKKMKGVMTRPYLRNLFFRISSMSRMGVKLIFVIDGEPPELKWRTIEARLIVQRMEHKTSERQNVRSNRNKITNLANQIVHPKKQTRSHFKAILNECCKMLDCMGIPYIQAAGEAEAMCAFLNYSGIVDACITNDGDAFLYGSKIVYRNFTMNVSDPHVECYSSEVILSTLCINRSAFIAMALFLGCDYFPKGISGVGKEMFTKLLNILSDTDILMRLQNWPHINEHELTSVERQVRKKTLMADSFPFTEIIAEYTICKDKLPTHTMTARRPRLGAMQKFMLEKLEWPADYTDSKVFPLLTLYDMRQIVTFGKENGSPLKPVRIIKKRIRRGVECFEVEWDREDPGADGSRCITIEESSLFCNCFPEIVNQWKSMAGSKALKKLGLKSQKAVSKISEEDSNSPPDICSAFAELSLTTMRKRNKDLASGLSQLSMELQYKIPDTKPLYSNLVTHNTATNTNISESTNVCSASHSESILFMTHQERAKDDLNDNPSDFGNDCRDTTSYLSVAEMKYAALSEKTLGLRCKNNVNNSVHCGSSAEQDREDSAGVVDVVQGLVPVCSLLDRVKSKYAQTKSLCVSRDKCKTESVTVCGTENSAENSVLHKSIESHVFVSKPTYKPGINCDGLSSMNQVGTLPSPSDDDKAYGLTLTEHSLNEQNNGLTSWNDSYENTVLLSNLYDNKSTFNDVKKSSTVCIPKVDKKRNHSSANDFSNQSTKSDQNKLLIPYVDLSLPSNMQSVSRKTDLDELERNNHLNERTLRERVCFSIPQHIKPDLNKISETCNDKVKITNSVDKSIFLNSFSSSRDKKCIKKSLTSNDDSFKAYKNGEFDSCTFENYNSLQIDVLNNIRCGSSLDVTNNTNVIDDDLDLSCFESVDTDWIPVSKFTNLSKPFQHKKGTVINILDESVNRTALLNGNQPIDEHTSFYNSDFSIEMDMRNYDLDGVTIPQENKCLMNDRDDSLLYADIATYFTPDRTFSADEIHIERNKIVFYKNPLRRHSWPSTRLGEAKSISSCTMNKTAKSENLLKPNNLCEQNHDSTVSQPLVPGCNLFTFDTGLQSTDCSVYTESGLDKSQDLFD